MSIRQIRMYVMQSITIFSRCVQANCVDKLKRNVNLITGTVTLITISNNTRNTIKSSKFCFIFYVRK